MKLRRLLNILDLNIQVRIKKEENIFIWTSVYDGELGALPINTIRPYKDNNARIDYIDSDEVVTIVIENK